MKTIQIQNTVLVVEKVAAVRLHDSAMESNSRGLEVFLVGIAAPVFIQEAGNNELAALVTAIST